MKKSNTFFRSELPAAVLLQTNLFFAASAFFFSLSSLVWCTFDAGKRQPAETHGHGQNFRESIWASWNWSRPFWSRAPAVQEAAD